MSMHQYCEEPCKRRLQQWKREGMKDRISQHLQVQVCTELTWTEEDLGLGKSTSELAAKTQKENSPKQST